MIPSKAARTGIIPKAFTALVNALLTANPVEATLLPRFKYCSTRR